MAFKALFVGGSGDMNDASYDYGYHADTILVMDSVNFYIRTCEGNDIVDFRRLQSGGYTTEVYAGVGNDTVLGGKGDENVHDGSGNDFVWLGAGTDTYYLSNGNDTVNGGIGNDWLDFRKTNHDGLAPVNDNKVAVAVDLALLTSQNFGVFGFDTVSGFENIFAGGGSDVLRGNQQANQLYGGLGADWLEGRGGGDSLDGAGGGDVFIGGQGSDHSYCGAADGARDRIVFTSLEDAGSTIQTADYVFEFEYGAGATKDRIDLHWLDGNAAAAGDQAFAWRGTGAFTTSAVCEVRKTLDNGDLKIEIDTDSDVQAEMIILIDAVTLNQISVADFIL